MYNNKYVREATKTKFLLELLAYMYIQKKIKAVSVKVGTVISCYVRICVSDMHLLKVVQVARTVALLNDGRFIQ